MINNIRANIYDDGELIASSKFYSLIELGEFLTGENYTAEILGYDTEGEE